MAGEKLVKLAENMINSIGSIPIPVKLNSSELTFSVNPKVDFSNVDLNNFSISQIEISDTSVGICLSKDINLDDTNFNISFAVDSRLKDWTASKDENGTKLIFDIAGTTIDQKIDLKVGASTSVIDIVSPGGTNDFQPTFAGKIKL